jgi:hypothetical protein
VWRDWHNVVDPTVDSTVELFGLISDAAFYFFVPFAFAVAMLTTTTIASFKAKSHSQITT